MSLTATLARLLNPLVWRRSGHAARKLHGFALAEHGSMLDLRLAARLTPSPARAAAYLRHADYTRALLFELAADEAAARRALRRVKRWEAWRSWLRAGRFLAQKVYVVTMALVYLLAAPLGLLVRVARPLAPGWRALESAADAPTPALSPKPKTLAEPEPESR